MVERESTEEKGRKRKTDTALTRRLCLRFLPSFLSCFFALIYCQSTLLFYSVQPFVFFFLSGCVCGNLCFVDIWALRQKYSLPPSLFSSHFSLQYLSLQRYLPLPTFSLICQLAVSFQCFPSITSC